MHFTPKTEQEIAESKLWPKGEYGFEIVDASEKNSKTSGKPMIELKVKLYDGKGAGRTITDCLLAETPEKLRHCADACGLLDRYNTGNLSGNEFKGKRGKLKLGIEKTRRKPTPTRTWCLTTSVLRRSAKRKAAAGCSRCSSENVAFRWLFMEQHKRDELMDLSWRYAALIGIIDHEVIDITAEEIVHERQRWAHLIKADDGLPCWDELEGAGYMAELSGATLEECRQALVQEWPPDD